MNCATHDDSVFRVTPAQAGIQGQLAKRTQNACECKFSASSARRAK